MYATYHGPSGLKRIAQRVHALTVLLAEAIKALGHAVGQEAFLRYAEDSIGQ